MKHLAEAIKKLNLPSTIDGEEYESLFNFETRIENGLIKLYDANESYHIDYLEEKNSLMYSCAEEFGFTFKPIKEDKVMKRLLEAVQADFGKDAYIEWENNVVMIIAK